MTIYLVVYLLGVLFGCAVMKLIHINKRSGNIIVSQDEDGTYLSLQVKRISDITSNKEVTLGIVSHK